MRVRAIRLLFIYNLLESTRVAGDADDLVVPGGQYPNTDQVSKDEMAGFITAFGSVCGLIGVSLWRGRGVDITVWVEKLIIKPWDKWCRNPWIFVRQPTPSLDQKKPILLHESSHVVELTAFHRPYNKTKLRKRFVEYLSTIEEEVDSASSRSEIPLDDYYSRRLSSTGNTTPSCSSVGPEAPLESPFSALDSPFSILPHNTIPVRCVNDFTISESCDGKSASGPTEQQSTIQMSTTSGSADGACSTLCFETPLLSIETTLTADSRDNDQFDWRLWCRLVDDNNPPGFECDFLV